LSLFQRCSAQLLWEASGSKVHECPLNFGKSFYKCPSVFTLVDVDDTMGFKSLVC
jgi:hypothetical protein